MDNKEIKLLYSKIKQGLNKGDNKLPSNCYFLSKETVLALPNPYGDSRHPYVRDGLTLWAYSSGYITINESNFYVIPTTLEGKEPYMAFFGGLLNKKGNYNYFSLTGVCDSEFGKDKVERYTVFTPTSVIYLRLVNKILYSLETTITTSKEIIFNLNVINLSNKEVDVYLSSYINPLLTHGNYESEETKWFRKSTINNDGATIYSVEDISREVHLHNYLVIKRHSEGNNECTCSRMFYTGDKNGQLSTSKCLRNGKFDIVKQVSQFIDMAIYGDINKKHLNAKESFSVNLKMSIAFNEEEVSRLENIPFEKEDNDKEFEILQKEYKKEFTHNKNKLVINCHGLKDINVSDETFNNFLYQVIGQVDYCSKAKNSSPMMLGVRDVAQMLEAMCMWNPQYVKEKLLYVFDYIYEDQLGRVPRQVGSFNHEDIALVDSRQFIDQGQWLITTTYKYLCYTEDYKILDKSCGYVTYIDRGHVKKSKNKSSLFIHLKDIIDNLVSYIDQDTKCLRTLFGDWNDAVDGLGVSSNPKEEYGNGVSVMASFHLYQNLSEFMKIAKIKGLDVSKYQKAQEELFEGLQKYAVVSKENEKRIVHGWGENRSFYVGSFYDVDGVSRHSSTSNSFYILSKYYQKDDSLIPSVLDSFKALDSIYGYKTFDVYFDKKNASKVGRIVNLPKGTAENAATYVHASMFAFKALSMIGETDLAYHQLLKLIPITHESISTSPFVMPNSYGYNLDLGINGQSMNDWYTGSSNTLLKGFVESFVGLEPCFDNKIMLNINKLPIKEVDLEITIKNRRIKYHQLSEDNKKPSIFINDVEQSSKEINLDEIKNKEILIEVRY